MPSDTKTDAEIADRLAIRSLMDRYGFAVDRQDWDLYRQVFTPTARIDYRDSTGVDADLETVVAWLAEALQHFVGLQHNMTNHLVEIDGDSARSTTYFLAFHSSLDGHGGEDVMTMGGFYRDRLVRTSDGWRIQERIELGTWMQGPYPQEVARPTWYGTTSHHVPLLPN